MTQYAVVLERGERNWSAYVPDLPGCVATGTLRIELEQSIREAIEFHIDGLKSHGIPVPPAVDEATDFLYGPAGAQKTNFALPPKGSGTIPPLVKLTDIKVTDGVPAKSIFFDWESISGSTYEVQWFTDSALTQQVGSAVSTSSEFTIAGLTSGIQYWMRVRPARGGEFGPWSDPATRVALA